MDTLKIHLFGRFRIDRGQERITKFPSCIAQHLFCYLVLHRHDPHSRNELASLFWGDQPEDKARHCLRTALWRLRIFLEPAGQPGSRYLIIENSEVGFNTDCDYWLDVEEFRKRLSVPQPLGASSAAASDAEADACESLAKAVELYEGDLLEDCYEDWCLYERERLREMLLNALIRLMACHRSRGAYAQAIRFGNFILSYDPILEEVHRELMRLHCLSGNRGAAVRQYRWCQAVLAKELRIAPMEETTALYNQICEGGAGTGEGEGERMGQPDLESGMTVPNRFRSQSANSVLAPYVGEALAELRQAQAIHGQLGARFQRAIQTLEDVRLNLRQT